MTLKYNKFKCYWAAVTKKNIIDYREGSSLYAQILYEKLAVSPATVVFEK